MKKFPEFQTIALKEDEGKIIWWDGWRTFPCKCGVEDGVGAWQRLERQGEEENGDSRKLIYFNLCLMLIWWFIMVCRIRWRPPQSHNYCFCIQNLPGRYDYLWPCIHRIQCSCKISESCIEGLDLIFCWCKSFSVQVQCSDWNPQLQECLQSIVSSK